MYKLILVDDDKGLLESFYEFIEWNKYGFEVVACLSNGLEAFKYIEQNHVDAIITDIRMPEMDGIELAGKLYERFPDIKIVFFSAFCDFHYARQAIKYGVVDYISKPIMYNDVEEILQKLYKDLENGNGEGYEHSADIISERETLFCRLLSSKRLVADSIKEELSGVKILYRSLYSKCVIALFEIIGMEKSLAQRWGNDRDDFVDAITKVVCVDTENYYAIRLNFSQNILSVLYVSKADTPISKERINVMIDELWSRYEVIAVNETLLTFNSFDEFREELTGSKDEKLKYLQSKIAVYSEEQMFYEVKKYVNEHYAEDINVKTAAIQCHFNEQYFGRQFKKAMGKSFLDYLNEVRVDKAKQLLRLGKNSETVWNEVGFGSRRTFERQFLCSVGETPEQYRKNQMERK